MLISIPMAIYNGEKFLDRAIESILAQSVKNWELICVDDGSTDKSFEIAKRYADRDSRIKIFRQENKGGPSARMLAYQHSTGDMVFTGVDQDDYVERDFVETLISDYNKSKAEIILCDWLLEQDNGSFQSFFSRHGRLPGEYIRGYDAFASSFPWSVHLIGLWSRRLVELHAVDPTNAFNNFNADEFLARKIALDADKIYLGSAKYYHCRNPDSVTTRLSLRMLASLETNKQCLSLAEERELPEEVRLRIIYWQMIHLNEHLSNIATLLAEADRCKKHITFRYVWSYLKILSADLRKYRRKTVRARLGAEKNIAKLTIKYAVARFRHFITVSSLNADS